MGNNNSFMRSDDEFGMFAILGENCGVNIKSQIIMEKSEFDLIKSVVYSIKQVTDGLYDMLEKMDMERGGF